MSQTKSVLNDEVVGSGNLDAQRMATIGQNFNRFRIQVAISFRLSSEIKMHELLLPTIYSIIKNRRWKNYSIF